MSVEVMTRVFKFSRSRGAARLILLAMADEASSSGLLTAYARSQSHLAAKAGITKRAATTAIQTLVELGEVEVLRKGDGRASSDYLLTIPDEGGSTDTPPELRDEYASPHSVNQLHPPSDPASPPSSRSYPVLPVNTIDDAFQAFWDSYPRKISKPGALAAWKKLRKEGIPPETLQASLLEWMRYWLSAKTAPEYIPHAATWLNQRRFEDLPYAEGQRRPGVTVYR